MSKAFASNSDDDESCLEGPALPPGTRNYMTPAGAKRLRAEVKRLTEESRTPARDVEGKARAAKAERQLRYWLPRLEALEIVDPLTQPADRITFGATVTLAEGANTETWRIVGLDETDLDRGWISWMSPLAAALLEKRAGDVLTFMGRRLSVRKIEYEP